MEWLTGPLPDDRKLVTLGVTEPFTTAVKVSLLAVSPRASSRALADLGIPRSGGRAELQRVVLVFVVIATGLFATESCSCTTSSSRVLDLTSYDDELYDIQIRASYYYSFAALTLVAGGIAFLMPIFVLGLVRLRVLTSDRLRSNRRIAFVVLLVFAILLPTVDPVSLRSRSSRSSSVRALDLDVRVHGAPLGSRLDEELAEADLS